jgi:SpoVK/Ycf46/Vps4 family AAA+-type ATPase
MQEKTAPVFVAATANRIDLLPAELLRKGRFDEIFFVDLPNETERTEIFSVHLNRLRPRRVFSYSSFIDPSKGFSGAEIEQVIIDAMFAAFGLGKELSTEFILEAIAQTTPLSKVAEQQINQIKSWASSNGVRFASLSNGLNSKKSKRLVIDE